MSGSKCSLCLLIVLAILLILSRRFLSRDTKVVADSTCGINKCDIFIDAGGVRNYTLYCSNHNNPNYSPCPTDTIGYEHVPARCHGGSSRITLHVTCSANSQEVHWGYYCERDGMEHDFTVSGPDCSGTISGGSGGCIGPSGANCFYSSNGVTCPSGTIPYPPCCCFYSPIIVDINGDGFSFTDAANGIRFDPAGTGTLFQVSWTTAGSDE